MKTSWQRWEALFTFSMTVFFGSIAWTTLGWDRRSGLFPWIILAPTCVLVVWQLIEDLRGRTSPPSAAAESHGDDTPGRPQALGEAKMLAALLGSLGAIMAFGFPIGGGISAFVLLRFHARESLIVSAIYAVVLALALEFIFRRVLGLPFPDPAILQLFPAAGR